MGEELDEHNLISPHSPTATMVRKNVLPIILCLIYSLHCSNSLPQAGGSKSKAKIAPKRFPNKVKINIIPDSAAETTAAETVTTTPAVALTTETIGVTKGSKTGTTLADFSVELIPELGENLRQVVTNRRRRINPVRKETKMKKAAKIMDAVSAVHNVELENPRPSPGLDVDGNEPALRRRSRPVARRPNDVRALAAHDGHGRRRRHVPIQRLLEEHDVHVTNDPNDGPRRGRRRRRRKRIRFRSLRSSSWISHSR